MKEIAGIPVSLLNEGKSTRRAPGVVRNMRLFHLLSHPPLGVDLEMFG